MFKGPHHLLPFQKELQKTGLSDKEAAVYLASLSLGASPVQTIARKARVARATTYIIIEALVERGLMTRYAESERTMYVAEPPAQLLRMLEKQGETIHKQREEIEAILPGLQAVMNIMDDRPLVRYYASVEGLRTMRREMVMYCGRGDVWYSFAPADELMRVFGTDELTYYDQRSAKGIKAKTLFTTKSSSLKKELLRTALDHGSERKFIPPDRYPSSSGLTVFRDRIAIASYQGKVGGIILESRSMATMLKSIFLITWECLDSLPEAVDNNMRA